jgi:hypothetical protein
MRAQTEVNDLRERLEAWDPEAADGRSLNGRKLEAWRLQ